MVILPAKLGHSNRMEQKFAKAAKDKPVTLRGLCALLFKSSSDL